MTPAQALDRNPYPQIHCYFCRGLAVKSSFDTYVCLNCRRTLLAAYPSDWHDRKITVFKRDRYHCIKCGRSLLYQEKHCDHIIPISMGGTHASSNLRTLCKDCHLAKHPSRQLYYFLNRGRYTPASMTVAASPRPPPPSKAPSLPWRPLLGVLLLLIALYFLTL